MTTKAKETTEKKAAPKKVAPKKEPAKKTTAKKTETKKVGAAKDPIIETVSYTATSKASQLVDAKSNAHYTFEASETISIPSGTPEDVIAEAKAELWDRTNGEVDAQLQEIYSLYGIDHDDE